MLKTFQVIPPSLGLDCRIFGVRVQGWTSHSWHSWHSGHSLHPPWTCFSVADVLVGLATDTTLYVSRRGEALQANKLTFTIRAADSSWHPDLPCPPFLAFLAFLASPLDLLSAINISFGGRLAADQSKNLALTVLYAPHSPRPYPPCPLFLAFLASPLDLFLRKAISVEAGAASPLVQKDFWGTNFKSIHSEVVG